MSDHHTYKKVELVGSSPTSIEDAINNALAEASKSLKHLSGSKSRKPADTLKTAGPRTFRSPSKSGSGL